MFLFIFQYIAWSIVPSSIYYVKLKNVFNDVAFLNYELLQIYTLFITIIVSMMLQIMMFLILIVKLSK